VFSAYIDGSDFGVLHCSCFLILIFFTRLLKDSTPSGYICTEEFGYMRSGDPFTSPASPTPSHPLRYPKHTKPIPIPPHAQNNSKCPKLGNTLRAKLLLRALTLTLQPGMHPMDLMGLGRRLLHVFWWDFRHL